MDKKLRGVNLGGWLVLERWMTPSVFADSTARDEYSLAASEGGTARMEKHRKSFIREADFAWLANRGVNAVRIPIGYWIFDGVFDELVHEKPSIRYLDQAVKWAAKYNIAVLIDLHGAPGSQNGRDHSGRLGRARWYRRRKYRQATIETLLKLAEHYKSATNVWGYELLNEPKVGLFQFKLRWFYRRAARQFRRVARPGTTIVFHDAFSPRLLAGALQAKSQFPVAIDIHWYQFTDAWRRWRSHKNYFQLVASRRRLIEKITQIHPVIIGEWSGVLSREFLRGKRPGEVRKIEAHHLQTQLDAYADAAGWFYWSYKTEGKGPWNFRWMVENGRITPGDIAEKVVH